MSDSTSQLEALREVMNQLRSPGGCPWDAEQSHESLLKYLLEESYEFIEAVEENDRAAMREELGDVLLQVFFHARMAEEHPTDPFSVEDVAHQIAVEHPLKLAPGTTEKELGAALLGILDQALALDIDPESALRSAIKDYIEQIKKYEAK